MKLIILGGGLAGISLAYFMQNQPEITSIDILEKEHEPGGLCRSFMHEGIPVDIGPHIFFSKDKETLDFMLDVLGENKHKLRRSNRILHKGKMVQYPFENDLSNLPEDDCKKCVDGFLRNPYKNYHAENMLQFFLKTFGEGITNQYLRPYNEKIWKFDPAFMDTQMVERIPRPPDEDIIRSAAGETVDGYTHQLYFSYPKSGGTAAFIEAFICRLNDKVTIHTDCEVTGVAKDKSGWRISTDSAEFVGENLVSCIPVDILMKLYKGIDDETSAIRNDLRYNNIIVAAMTVSEDRAGDNFAFMIADRDVAFHRLSKIDFLGEAYHKKNTATYMIEYTYRDGDPVSGMTDDELKELFTDGMTRIGFVKSQDEVVSFTPKRFPYAYVIYDLFHKQNMTKIRSFFSEQGVTLHGRFGNFEYWNMDKVIAESKILASNILETRGNQR